MKTTSYVVQKFVDHIWDDRGVYDEEALARHAMSQYRKMFPERLYRLVQRETTTRDKVIK